MAEPGPARLPPPVPFGAALRVWIKIGFLSFGGPAGQIAVMHRILVEEKRWIGENRFLHALNYCMLLPGPEAQQLAVLNDIRLQADGTVAPPTGPGHGIEFDTAYIRRHGSTN